MIADLGIDFLAAGIGNIHGKYPANWKGLSFETLDAIQQLTGDMPLVLHGGTGIPTDMIKNCLLYTSTVRCQVGVVAPMPR